MRFERLKVMQTSTDEDKTVNIGLVLFSNVNTTGQLTQIQVFFVITDGQGPMKLVSRSITNHITRQIVLIY